MESNQPMRTECLMDDVVFDILTELPVKPLIRFRCVSKSCNSIITSPLFITTHFKFNKAKSLSNNNNHNGYLLYDSPSPSRELSTIIYNPSNARKIISKPKVVIVASTEGRKLGKKATYPNCIFKSFNDIWSVFYFDSTY